MRIDRGTFEAKFILRTQLKISEVKGVVLDFNADFDEILKFSTWLQEISGMAWLSSFNYKNLRLLRLWELSP
jgi:hypothetical protein